LSRQLREFIVGRTDAESGAGASATVGMLGDALRPRFELGAGRSATVRHVWLDTFDWRLHRAGVSLEYSISRGAHRLSLLTRDSVQADTAVPRLSLPALTEQLPAGPLREHLAPIMGIRALLPIVSFAGTTREVRVLDTERKTIAYLTVDEAAARRPLATAWGPHATAPGSDATAPGSDATAPGSHATGSHATALAPRIRIAAVRGYDAQADRVERLIGGLPGVAAAAESAFHAAAQAAGMATPGYTNRVDVALAPSMAAGPALARVLLRLLDTAQANVDGAVRDADTEFLHDLRVAVRRTRAALKLAGDALPDGVAARFAAEFGWLGQLTTPTRDLDVHLLGFDAAAAGLATAAPADLEPLRASLLRYRAAERRRLIRGLRSARFTSLTSDWRAALSEVRAAGDEAARRPGPTTHVPIADLAATRTRRAYARLVRTGSAVTPAADEDQLHLVRKRGKELRYVLEFFATLYEPAIHRSAVRELKQLQDCLGDIQDGHVQREAIRALAERMVAEHAAPAATLLAMGELAAQLDATASRARGDFARRFAQFTSPRNTRRLALLAEVAA